MCVCLYIVESHRCTASWKVKEGIRTVSLRHLVQHRQELDGMSRLVEKRRDERRGEERKGGRREERDLIIIM